MENLSLQFQAVASQRVLSALLAAIVVILLVAGLRRLAQRRWKAAGFHLLAGAVPAFGLPALLLTGAGQSAWMALLGAAVLAAVAVFYSAVYGDLGSARLAGLLGLRTAAIAALLLVLFRPAVSVTVDPDSLKPPLPILVDRSLSMATVDHAGSPSRLGQAVSALAAQRARLAEAFRLQWRPFAAAVQQAKSPETIAASGEGADATDLALAIANCAAEGGTKRPPAMVLVSDGIANAGADAAEAASQAGTVIYVVAVGSANPPGGGKRNAQLISVDSPLEVAKNNIATIRATIRAEQLAGVPVEVRLTDEAGGEPLATAMVTPENASATATAELKWLAKSALPDTASSTATGSAGPSGTELRRLVVSVAPSPGQAVTEDNAAPLHVLLTESRIGILYVEGTIRPEYKYLKRLFDSDPQVQLLSLVRVSGNKFWAQGGINGRVLSALPAKDEDFAGIDVVILGDLDRGFVTDAKMSALRKFVNNGGGLLMLGGHNSLGPGGYGGTELEAILPVTLGGRDQAQETAPFLPQLTAAGAAHPAMAGLGDFLTSLGAAATRPASSTLPNLAGCVAVAAAKPSATVLAVHPSRQNAAGPLVILATQQVGGGRSAIFTADTTWRWFLPMQAMGEQSPYHRFWGQLIRYLASADLKGRSDKPAAVLRVDRAFLRSGESARVTARVLSGEKPIDQASVSCTLAPAEGGGQGQAVVLTPRGGLLEGKASPSKLGRYRLRLAATDAGGKEIAADELSLQVAGQSAETEQLARNDKLLRQIASASGGKYVELSGLANLVDELVGQHQAPSPAQPVGGTYRLYNFPLLFVLFVALLTTEWALRRRWQLH